MLWNIQEHKTSVMLSHWGWDKMAAIFADDISCSFSENFISSENFWILNKISLNYVP